MAAKAVCFKLAMAKDFKNLQEKTLKNAAGFATQFEKQGYRIVSGGTENPREFAPGSMVVPDSSVTPVIVIRCSPSSIGSLESNSTVRPSACSPTACTVSWVELATRSRA